MSQKDLVLSLHKEGLTAKAMHERLVEIFGPLAMPYSTVTRTFKETCWTPFEQGSKQFGGRPPNLEHDARFLYVLEKNPNASVCEIADEARIPKSIVFNVLRGRLHDSWRNCRLVPHALTEAQRRERVEKSIALLSLLAKAKRSFWQFIITSDESWFFYVTPHSKIWLPCDADMPEVARQLINTPKVMVTIFWNSFGIHVLAELSEKTSFDAGYFVDYVLTRIEELPIMHTAVSQKEKLIIHTDNSLIHKSRAAIQKIKSMPVKLAPHPPYSPDLAPSDFSFWIYQAKDRRSRIHVSR
jgi:histone-lysine N-methyltransferase SETMAR